MSFMFLHVEIGLHKDNGQAKAQKTEYCIKDAEKDKMTRIPEWDVPRRRAVYRFTMKHMLLLDVKNRKNLLWINSTIIRGKTRTFLFAS